MFNRHILDRRFTTPASTTVRSSGDVGKLLRARRRELGLKQEDVAASLGMSPRLIGEVENGKDGVGLLKVLNIAHLLGFDLVLSVRGK